MDEAQGGFGALCQTGSQLEDAVLLKSPKVEIPDEQDEEEEMLATVKEEEMIIKQDLKLNSFFFTNIESTANTPYSENLVTNFKTEQIENETSEKTSDLENKASDDAVLLKSSIVEISGEPDKDEEILAMLIKEENIIEQDLKSCFLTNSESPADTLYSENMDTNFKTELLKRELSEGTSDLENQASGADVCVSSTPTLPRGVSFEPGNDCGKQFDKKPHCSLQHKTLPHQCDDCGRRFTINGELQRHMKTPHSVDKSTFGVHYKTSSLGLSNEQLKTHIGEKTFSCSMYGQKCSIKQHLEAHSRVHTGEKTFSCSVCTYTSSLKSDLKAHLKNHADEKPFSCSVCTYTCSQKCSLKRHLTIHTGEKPFSCSVCTYTCARKSDLKLHLKIHTGEKPFSCSVCGYKFSRTVKLKEHMRVHTGEKPFSCSVCEYKCSQKGKLKEHMRVHTGEQPFSCSVCGYKCSQRGKLKEHMRVHTGEKPFSCSVCGHKFSRKNYLTKHMLVHTGEKPFSCSICGYKCSQKHNLNVHMRRAHTGEK